MGCAGPAAAAALAGLPESVRAIASEHRVPGGALVLVAPKEVVLDGFGVAQRPDRPVTPRTVFPVAAAAPVVTALTTLRLASAGSLDLDVDLRVGRPWLQARAPGTAPVTLRQLLTHTAGFDDPIVGMHTLDPAQVGLLGELVQSRLSRRAVEAERMARRSEIGLALVGHVIEQATGQTFAETAQRRVLAPLGMQSSSFVADLEATERDRLARAYPCPDARCEALPMRYSRVQPAFGLRSSAEDIARLIDALLRAGHDSSRGDQETHITAHAWRPREGVPGTTLGMHEQALGGQRALVAAAEMGGYRSVLAVIPDAGVGMLLVVNGGLPIVGSHTLAALARAIGPSGPVPALKPEPSADPAAYVGVYLNASAPRTNHESFAGRFLFADAIAADASGHLIRVEGAQVRRYGWVRGDMFAAMDGEGELHFDRDAGGTIIGMHAPHTVFGGRFPTYFERLSGWRTPSFVNQLLAWTLSVPLAIALVWVFVEGARLERQKRSASAARPVLRRRPEERVRLLLAFVLVASAIAFGFAFMLAFKTMALAELGRLELGMPPALARWQWLPTWIALLTAVVVALTARGLALRTIRWWDAAVLGSSSAGGIALVMLLVEFRMLAWAP